VRRGPDGARVRGEAGAGALTPATPAP
jgi:hypothetical protein